MTKGRSKTPNKHLAPSAQVRVCWLVKDSPGSDGQKLRFFPSLSATSCSPVSTRLYSVFRGTISQQNTYLTKRGMAPLSYTRARGVGTFPFRGSGANAP